ncbi:hypothetical protein [Wolbachia endosymbiont of Drosophila pseudotakahashii]|uniref:hypothetical protein n=2 Tax=Wolbachia endosymbiont of Drosophila pseudotakahashii TaxID=375919 RepID=UPI00222F7705|nr:hypothetical protein [Wolbachia endosymbiont of Drosophila pseudotakahashii]UZE38799.1 hypothetical protein ONI09_01505 [Wolbachia endosymbiont of Drosophila pseudotakahashii]
MYGRKIVRALVSAFNVHNYARNTVKTNFTLQSRGGEDYIVVSFDKGMKDYQCSEYLDSIKRKIIREFYGIEESNDKEILDTAKKDFDVTSFPFNYIYKGDWSVDKQGRIEFVAPVDQGVIFNLKSHLAASLAKGVLEDMRVSSTAVPFNKKKYLWCGEFDNKQLREEFEREFLSRMENRYGYRNGFKNPLKVKGNSVYIRDVFDDARFIDSVARYITWLKGMGLQADSKVRGDVKAFKELIMEFIDQPTEIIIAGFVCASPLGREEASVLIPLVLNGGRKRILTNEEALKLNHAFNGAVFNDLYGGTQGELAINGGNGLYSIDFSNPYISHCVITKIIESSVINAKHELAIDPELPRTLLAEASQTQEFPKRSRGKGLERPPRQESEIEGGKRGLFQLVPEEIDSSQSTCGQSQLSLTRRPPSILSPRAWDSSTFLNSGVSEDSLKDTANICNKEPEKQQVTKEKEEEKLFKALLYWFNLSNYALDPPHTSFIVKNGKIASLIDDGVDVKEYLQEIIDKTKEEYRVNKEEAYDFNEFPFQFLSNCEKNQETTVVANISRGALLNLKELFSREHEGKVEIKDIDINIVEKAVKSEKDKWVNFQVQEHGLSPKKAIKTCYPDESVLEYISITKDKGGYWINRDYDGSEVELFRGERWPAKDKSKAEKMKPEDNKDSGYSSGFVTDAENVSSKAEATTSGYESMDCKNTRGGSPKRKSPSPEDGGSPRKSPKRDSLPLSRLESLSLSSSSHQIGKC